MGRGYHRSIVFHLFGAIATASAILHGVSVRVSTEERKEETHNSNALVVVFVSTPRHRRLAARLRQSQHRGISADVLLLRVKEQMSETAAE